MNPETKELLEQLEIHKQNMTKTLDYGANSAVATPMILREHAFIAIILSKFAEIETRRIITLTRWLCGLTCGLLAVAVVQVVIMVFQELHHVP